MNVLESEQVAVVEAAAEEPELTGIPAPNGHPVPLPESQKWITRRLIDSTKRVWSKRYGRPITTGEAVEILVNVKNLAAAFLGVLEKGEQE